MCIQHARKAFGLEVGVETVLVVVQLHGIDKWSIIASVQSLNNIEISTVCVVALYVLKVV